MSRSGWILIGLCTMVGFSVSSCSCSKNESKKGGEDLGTNDLSMADFAGIDLAGADLTGTKSGGDGGGASCSTAVPCTGGQVCVNNACVCPPYQALCNGSCMAVSNDPNNCGACGSACTGSTFCWLGKCVSACPFDNATGEGLKACGNSCVDTASDNANCGTCGRACMNGQVCADGNCVTGLLPSPGPSACMGVGPPIIITTPTGSTCAGNLAQTSFTWALCACKNVTINGNLTTDAFNSTQGPYTPGGKGGAVGMNGSYDGNQLTDVGGTFWTSSTAGLTANQNFATHQDLYVNGPIDCNQQCSVDIDAHINGNITVNAPMTITGTLYAPNNPPAQVHAGAFVKGAVTVGPACACDPSQPVPVNAIVDARQSNNDNASIGLDPAALANFGPTTRLDLPCGNYYLNSINTNSSLTIVAHGHTALYIGGGITTNQNFEITVDPTGSFDVFVKGTIDTNQKFVVGSLNAPALMRLYLGSTSALSLNQGFQLAGNLYSALSAVDENESADIYGAIFSGSFDSNQDTNIHYDNAVTFQGGDCPSPSPMPGGCGSCQDCNNQACINGMCTTCTTDADCCAPLMCVSGQCISKVG
jgi:hypothetical protein